MGRYSGGGSTGHHILRLDTNCFRISWTVDYYYAGSRLRFPRGFSRHTNLTGARRFARKWKLMAP